MRKKNYLTGNPVLLADDRLWREGQDTLSRMYRKLLMDGQVGPGQFATLVERYAKRKHSSPSKQLSEQANITNALTAPTMTFRTFLIGLDILELTAAHLTGEFHWRNGVVTKIQDVLDNSTYPSGPVDP